MIWYILEVLDTHAPIQNRRIRNKPSPWLTPAIKKLMYHGDYLKKRAIGNGSHSSYEAYKKQETRSMLPLKRQNKAMFLQR